MSSESRHDFKTKHELTSCIKPGARLRLQVQNGGYIDVKKSALLTYLRGRKIVSGYVTVMPSGTTYIDFNPLTQPA